MYYLVSGTGDGSFEVTQEVYTFLGWYKDTEFEQRVTSLTLDLGDATLYAKWSEPTVQKETKQYVRVNKNNEVDADGGYILFGQYPQTIKSADVTVGGTVKGSIYGGGMFGTAKVSGTVSITVKDSTVSDSSC